MRTGPNGMLPARAEGWDSLNSSPFVLIVPPAMHSGSAKANNKKMNFIISLLMSGP